MLSGQDLLVSIQKPTVHCNKRKITGDNNNNKWKLDILEESSKGYKSNYSVIIHTDTTSPDFIARINTVTENKVNWISDWSHGHMKYNN